MEFSGIEKIVEADGEDEEGWVETTHQLQENADGSVESEMCDKVCEMTLDSSKLEELMNDNEKDENCDEDDENGEAIDMEEFEESGLLEQVDPVSTFCMISISLFENYN